MTRIERFAPEITALAEGHAGVGPVNERERWAVYAAIVAALATGHPRRYAIQRLPCR